MTICFTKYFTIFPNTTCTNMVDLNFKTLEIYASFFCVMHG